MVLSNNKKPAASVIVTTYNRPDALRLVLESLDQQDTDDFEVIVVDDGSEIETKNFLDELKGKVKYELKHVWQEHKGFRAAMLRNKGAALSRGEYLIFLDGDSIVQKTFVSRHLKIAEPSYFIAGNRILLSSDFTKEILKNGISLHRWNALDWFFAFCHGKVSRFIPILSLGKLYWRYFYRYKWEGAKTHNLGVWRKDFFAINGFDEGYYGWGYEDSDFAVRLIRNKVLRKDGRFAVAVFHLWHPNSSRDRELINRERFEKSCNSSNVKAEKGVDQYTEDFFEKNQL